MANRSPVSLWRHKYSPRRGLRFSFGPNFNHCDAFKFIHWWRDMVSPGCRDVPTGEESSDFQKIRIFIQNSFRNQSNHSYPNPDSVDRVVQTLHCVLEEAVQEGLVIRTPQIIIPRLSQRFREVCPEEWEMAERLWKDHINAQWDKLCKRLHLIEMFRQAKIRANRRLYLPGGEQYQDCKERFEAMKQTLSTCGGDDPSSPSSNSSFSCMDNNRKRQQRDDDGDDGSEGEIRMDLSAKRRKL